MKHNKKFLSLLLTVCMAVSLIPATVMADTGKAQNGRSETVVSGLTKLKLDSTIHTTIESAGKDMAEQMANREPTVTVTYQFPEDVNVLSMSDSDFETYIFGIYDDILAQSFTHTGVPYEGDYIKWHITPETQNVGISYTAESVTFSTPTYYYTTAEQEQQVGDQIDAILQSLDLDGKSEYEQFIAIYDYITENVFYDYENLEDDSYSLKYSAYAALINHTSVCQGYANLLYRMLLTVGIDCRIIVGKGNGGDHAWNIVEIDKNWYNVDATWDSPSSPLRRFSKDFCLKSVDEFPDHVRNSEFLTDEFATSPVSYGHAPGFLGHSLEIYDSIAMVYWVEVPADLDTSTLNCVFTVGEDGNTRVATVPFSKAKEVSTNNHTYYKFVCEMNALEIADPIVARLNYGDGYSVENTYSILEYCEDIRSNKKVYGAEAVNAVDAIQDYGYYMFQCVDDGWTDKKSHKAFTLSDPDKGMYTDADIARVDSVVSAYPFTVKNLPNWAESVVYSLSLTSKTKINIYFRSDATLTGTLIPVMMNNEQWYKLTIDNVGPSSFTSIYAMDYLGVRVSPLSYINSILDQPDTYPLDKKNAMVAYYDYYVAVMAYYDILF